METSLKWSLKLYKERTNELRFMLHVYGMGALVKKLCQLVIAMSVTGDTMTFIYREETRNRYRNT